MKMNARLEEAFNSQLAMEFESFYAYLQLAAWFERNSFPGFGQWMRLQADEERSHAMKIYDYIGTRGNRITLNPIAAPKTSSFESPVQGFETALENEKKVSAAIQKLYGIATDEGDYASFQLLQWFLTEQIEEEETVSQIVDQLHLAGGNGAALLMLDRELAQRSAVPEDPAA